MYTFDQHEDGIGITFEFRGPGLSRYAPGVHTLQITPERTQRWLKEDPTMPRSEAEKIGRMLNIAFEAGRETMRAELRKTLGLP